VLSAVIVLSIGVLLAGVVEGLVKGALASVDLKTARLMGKIASYTVVSVAVLAAFSELNIAASFINILFIGFVSMLALGFGLAIGLGAKDVVGEVLSDWYKDLKKELKK
jgi:small-conductance mechanosensitive channel